MGGLFYLQDINTISDINCKSCLFFKNNGNELRCLKGSSKCGIDSVCPIGKWLLYYDKAVQNNASYEEVIEKFYKEYNIAKNGRQTLKILVPKDREILDES